MAPRHSKQNGATTAEPVDNIIRFPAKLTRTMKRRLELVELKAQHAWFVRHDDKWVTAATDGRIYHDHVGEMLRRKVSEYLGMKEPTLAKMRKEIAEGRRRIEKRNRIKKWMLGHGATDTDLFDSNTALAFVFDRLQEHGTAPAKVERQQNVDASESEAQVHDAQLQTMLKAFIRKELGASPVKPKLYAVNPHTTCTTSDRAED